MTTTDVPRITTTNEVADMTTDLDQFLAGYIDAVLFTESIGEDFARFWAEKTGEDEPAGDVSFLSFGFTSDDIAADALESMRADCADFLATNAEDIDTYCELLGTWHGSDSVRGADARYTGMERAGDDFWLSRNGHGAGFFDRGNDPVFQRLQDAAKVYGEAYVYVGDDEQIHS